MDFGGFGVCGFWGFGSGDEEDLGFRVWGFGGFGVFGFGLRDEGNCIMAQLRCGCGYSRPLHDKQPGTHAGYLPLRGFSQEGPGQGQSLYKTQACLGSLVFFEVRFAPG